MRSKNSMNSSSFSHKVMMLKSSWRVNFGSTRIALPLVKVDVTKEKRQRWPRVASRGARTEQGHKEN